MNKKIIFILIFQIVSYCAFSASSLAGKINNLLLMNNFNVGIEIAELPEKNKEIKTIYERNSHRYFLPASNEKLFLAYAALNFLGPFYLYHTDLYIDKNKIKNHVLYGNVYLRFMGDPTFTYEQLENLIINLKKLGINIILGHIIIDDTYFDHEPMSKGTSWDDQLYCFGSPIDAIIINHNCNQVYLLPSLNPGSLAHFITPPHYQHMHFHNDVLTSDLDNSIQVEKNSRGNYFVKGNINQQSALLTVEMAIDNPRAQLVGLLAAIFKNHHIQYKNPILFGKIPIHHQLLFQAYSNPLFSLLTIMLKNSDNTIANALFKTLGQKFYNEPGSFKNGQNAMQQILKNIIPETNSHTFVDGSGASYYNYVTPQELITLLATILRDPKGQLMISALPISGTDGTLKTWFINDTEDHLRGKILAKTGSLNSVLALSGFLFAKNHKTYLFSILINNAMDIKAAKSLIEKILYVLNTSSHLEQYDNVE